MAESAAIDTGGSSSGPRSGDTATGGVAVELGGVVRRFGADVHVLDGIDLSVPAGQFLAILGPSGCGKSTLLRLIAALDGADAGSLQLDRRAIHKHRPPTPEAIAFVFQQAQLLPWRTLVRNVELPLELVGVGKRERRARALQLIEQVGLSDAADRYPAQLSGGMQMRASLARALITDPKVLLLDEPFAALDEITRQRLDEQLYRLWQRRRMTVLFVTHSIGEAVFLSQRVVVMTQRPASIALDHPVELTEERDLDTRGTLPFHQQVQVLHKALHRAEGSR